MRHTVTFRIRRPGAAALMTLEIFEEDGAFICGVYKVRGEIDKRPKAWVAAVREEIRTIEGIARDAGCKELRIGGRDWSRVLPDFVRLDGVPNGLRKAL